MSTDVSETRGTAGLDLGQSGVEVGQPFLHVPLSEIAGQSNDGLVGVREGNSHCIHEHIVSYRKIERQSPDFCQDSRTT